MSKSVQFLDKVLEISGLPSDYALAQEIGKNRNYFTEIRRGKMQAGVYAVTRLAQKYGLDAQKELAAIQLEKARNPTEREFWKAQLDEPEFRLTA